MLTVNVWRDTFQKDFQGICWLVEDRRDDGLFLYIQLCVFASFFFFLFLFFFFFSSVLVGAYGSGESENVKDNAPRHVQYEDRTSGR